MNFCENCNIACQQDVCPKCGRAKLRQVQDDDFCMVAQLKKLSGDMLKYILQEKNIEYVLMPYGTGVNSKFALSLENYRLYVQYKNVEEVRAIIQDFGC